MKKRVLLLAVSCKTGGLCPGGLDLDNPSEWIRIVEDDGCAGAVQGYEIDFASPLDVIEFEGRPMPEGAQKENWVIDNDSCRRLGNGVDIIDGISTERELLDWAFQKYNYHGFWGNYRNHLTDDELNALSVPSESIMRVSNVRIYQDDNQKAKIEFSWTGSRYPIKWVSMTDQEYYDIIKTQDVNIDDAYIVISIPKDCWYDAHNEAYKAFKFVSKVFSL